MLAIKDEDRAAEDLVCEATLDTKMKGKQKEERQDSSKTKDTPPEEAQHELDPEKAKEEVSPAQVRPKKGLWLGNMVPVSVKTNEVSQSEGPVLTEPAPVLDYNEELTKSDLKVMKRLGVSQKTYGKLPRALVEQLKKAEAELGLLGGLKKFFRMTFANNVKTPQPGMDYAGATPDLKAVKVEEASDSDDAKRPIIVILVHPNVTDMHIVQDLAREMVDMICKNNYRFIESFYQCEYIQTFCRPCSSKQEAMTKVESTGNFRLINLEKYNRVAREELRKNWGRARRRFPRHISMDVSRKEVFDMVLEDTKARNYYIITDRVAAEPMDKSFMVRQYHENLMRKTNRNVKTVYINCDSGRYTHCLLRSNRLITNEEKWIIEARQLAAENKAKHEEAAKKAKEEKEKKEKNGNEAPGSSS